MRREFLLAVVLLAATSWASAGEGTAAAAGDPARAQVLGAKYRVDAGRILGLRTQAGMQWVDIERALYLAGAVTNNTEKAITMEAALNRVLELRAMGLGWNDIAQHFGTRLPEAGAQARKAGISYGSRAEAIRGSATSRALAEPELPTKATGSEK